MSRNLHVVVAGGAGFVGSHLCELLLDEGYSVTALDNFVTGSRQNVEGLLKAHDGPLSSRRFELVECDVVHALPDAVGKRIAALGLEAVLHLASPASPVDFDRIPFEILLVGSEGTRRLTQLAAQNGARFVLASTSEIYGDPLEHPQKESYFGNVNPVGPRACYDEAKRFAEAWVSSATRGIAGRTSSVLDGQAMPRLKGGIVRIFNTYGPRMRVGDGRVTPEFCIQALKGQSLTVHGDGSQTRSFCYVKDLVRGIYLYMKSDLSEPINLGNSEEFTVREFAEQLIALTGNRSTVREMPPRPEDPRKRRPDLSKARQLLGYEPKVQLREGLKLTLDYFANQLSAHGPEA